MDLLRSIVSKSLSGSLIFLKILSLFCKQAYYLLFLCFDYFFIFYWGQSQHPPVEACIILVINFFIELRSSLFISSSLFFILMLLVMLCSSNKNHHIFNFWFGIIKHGKGSIMLKTIAKTTKANRKYLPLWWNLKSSCEPYFIIIHELFPWIIHLNWIPFSRRVIF